MDPIVGEIVNCDNLYIAQVLQDDADAFVTGTPEYLAPLGEDKYDPKVSNASSAYDGAIMFNYFSEGVGENTITIPGLAEKRAAQITGKPYDPTKGIIFDHGDLSKIPTYALGYRHEFGSADGTTYYKYYWFLKGNFQISATTAKTKGEKIDAQSQEVTFFPLKTIHKWAVPDPKDAGKTITTGLKRSVGDTTDPAFTTEADWFSQVQTPDTVNEPAEIALSVSVPADDATGVLVTAHPTLTFNNKIASDDILLIKSSDNSVVTITKSYDSTGKILTITPSANLTSAAVYQIIVAGVKDIFGQSLAPRVINFTAA